MNLAHHPTKLLITGKSGCGKSTYFTKFIEGSDHVQKFIFDHEGEFAYRLGITPFFNFDELQKGIKNPYVIFDPSVEYPGAIGEAFLFFCEWVFEIAKNSSGTKLFCCDELQRLVGTTTVPHEFSLLIETGRRYEVDTVFVSQQPNIIHNRIRNQITEVVAFQTLDQAATKFLAGLGFSEDELNSLDRGAYISLSLDTGKFVTGKIF